MSEVQELEKQREDFKKLIHKRDLVLKLQKLNAFKELYKTFLMFFSDK